MQDKHAFKVEVMGHEWAINLFNRQQTTGHVPQALLLTGPPNVGKSTIARFFAQKLNCQEAEPRPCGRCSSCRKIVTGNHPDVRIFDRDDETIKIEEIRSLQRELALSPLEGRYRVALLCNFERATLSAANALLKTLEEPAPQVSLILTAIDPGGLLATIVSRCQTLTLKPLPTPFISEVLQTYWHASPERAELLAQLAAGRLGWAVRALADEELLKRRDCFWQELQALLRTNRVERLAYAHRLSRDPAQLKEALALWLTIWRDLLLLQSGSHTKIINLDWQQALQTMAAQGHLAQSKDMVSRLRFALINLERNVNPRLNLETVLLKLPTYFPS